MGIRIDPVKGEFPFGPVKVELTLTCDGPDHQDLFSGGAPPIERFAHPSGFMGCYSTAMSHGWKDTFRKGERVFFGPCCSGKRNLAHREESD